MKKKCRTIGHVDRALYRAHYVNGIRIMEHRRIWEEYHGRKIPDDREIHHRDGNTLNNSIENLQLISHRSHMRFHKGWKKVDGKWWKTCSDCKKLKPLEDFRILKGNRASHQCRTCERSYHRRFRKDNLEKRKAEGRAWSKRKRCDPQYREDMRQYLKLYRETHGEELRAKARAKYQKMTHSPS